MHRAAADKWRDPLQQNPCGAIILRQMMPNAVRVKNIAREFAGSMRVRIHAVNGKYTATHEVFIKVTRKERRQSAQHQANRREEKPCLTRKYFILFKTAYERDVSHANI